MIAVAVVNVVCVVWLIALAVATLASGAHTMSGYKVGIPLHLLWITGLILSLRVIL